MLPRKKERTSAQKTILPLRKGAPVPASSSLAACPAEVAFFAQLHLQVKTIDRYIQRKAMILESQLGFLAAAQLQLRTAAQRVDSIDLTVYQLLALHRSICDLESFGRDNLDAVQALLKAHDSHTGRITSHSFYKKIVRPIPWMDRANGTLRQLQVACQSLFEAAKEYQEQQKEKRRALQTNRYISMAASFAAIYAKKQRLVANQQNQYLQQQQQQQQKQQQQQQQQKQQAQTGDMLLKMAASAGVQPDLRERPRPVTPNGMKESSSSLKSKKRVACLASDESATALLQARKRARLTLMNLSKSLQNPDLNAS